MEISEEFASSIRLGRLVGCERKRQYRLRKVYKRAALDSPNFV